MTPTKSIVRDDNYKPIEKSLKACLVTDQHSLSESVRSHWAYSELQVKDRLVDLIGDHECGLYIIDTAVNDMNIWPAPLLANPGAQSKLWVFLVSGLSDTARFEQFPSNAKFFDRDNLRVRDLVSFVKKRFAPDSAKRIEEVHYSQKIKSFLVRMGNGKTYVLRISNLSEADSSPVTECHVADDDSHFIVVQESRNRFEVPWDDVLYHCEPEYEYYKGRTSTNAENAVQIGQRIRQLRLAKGYSIQELAEKCGMERPNLSRLEHGKHRPSLDTLERIAATLGVSVAELVAKPSSVLSGIGRN